MKLGFLTPLLKTLGTTALPLAEQLGVTAANAALPGLGGLLANIAVKGINDAIAKHGTAPAATPSPTDPTMTIGQAKKFDVLQTFESEAPDILNLILAGQSKMILDRATFVQGTDELVEAFLKIMKSIGAIPSNKPPTDPVVITPAVIAETQSFPAPAPIQTAVMPTPVVLAPEPIDPVILAQIVSAVKAALGK